MSKKGIRDMEYNDNATVCIQNYSKNSMDQLPLIETVESNRKQHPKTTSGTNSYRRPPSF